MRLRRAAFPARHVPGLCRSRSRRRDACLPRPAASLRAVAGGVRRGGSGPTEGFVLTLLFRLATGCAVTHTGRGRPTLPCRAERVALMVQEPALQEMRFCEQIG